MPDASFDPLIHAPQRLRICAITFAATSVEFGELQKRLNLSKSALSKHLSQLVEHGYLEQEQVLRGRYVRVRLTLTDHGRRAYTAHIAALRSIIDEVPHEATADAELRLPVPAATVRGGEPDRES